MSIMSSYILPHPPLAVSEVGQGREAGISATLASFNEVAEEIASLKPDTIVLVSPHTVSYADYFHISPGSGAEGDFSQFGARDVRIKADYDEEFVDTLSTKADGANFPAGKLGEQDNRLDHGVTVPLYFINKRYTGYKLVRIGISGESLPEHYRLGILIAETSLELGRRTVFIASGDLSHKLKSDGPYGFAAEGSEFDKMITESASSGDFLRWLKTERSFADSAGECGLRSFIIMAGALDGKSVKPALLSYEGPFGVGYAVCKFSVTGNAPDRHFDKEYMNYEKERLGLIKASEGEYARLARHAAEYYVKNKKDIDIPADLSGEMLSNKAGVFVSVKKRGALRGCIGTIQPVADNIALEIIRNARSAVSADPRFSPVSESELGLLTYSVDILGSPEVTDFAGLDPYKYGVIVTSGHKRGLLLPNLEGVDTAEEQVRIAREKAGISAGESCTLERFEVIRHT